MNRNILEEMQLLSESLKDVPELGNNQTINNIRDSYEKADENLLYLQTSVGSEILVPGSVSEEEYESALLERTSIEDELLNTNRILEKLDRQTKNFEMAVKHNENVYNLSEGKLESLRKELEEESLSQEDKDRIRRKIDKLKKAIEEIDANRESLNKRLEASKKRTEEISATRDELQEKLNNFEMPEYKYKVVTEDDIKSAELDVETLRFAYNFYSSNPKEEIDKTIKDYNSGLIDEKTLNERLQNLKFLLTSGLYKDYFSRLKEEREQREKRIGEVEKEIESQKELVLKENRQANNRIEKEIQDNLLKLGYYKALIDNNADVRFLPRYKIIYKELEDKVEKLREDKDNLLVNGKGTDKLRDLEMLHLSLLTAKKASENDLDIRLESLIEKTGGQNLVEVEGKQVPSYFPESLIKILNDNEVKKINEHVSDVVNETLTKAKKENPNLDLDEEEIAKKVSERVEDKAPIIESHIEKNSKNDEEPEVVDNSVADGPLTEVAEFEEIEKSKLDKLKEKISKKWKSIVAKTAVVGLAITLLCTSCCNSKRRNDSPSVVEPTAIAENIKVERIQTPKPTKAPIYGSVSTPTPDPTELPTPDPTPTPTPTDPLMDGRGTYVLNTQEKIEAEQGPVGDSRYADETKPQLMGDSVYNPVTETWIDSEGTKITRTEEGDFIKEEDNTDVVDKEDGTVTITNPDMTPIEHESESDSEVTGVTLEQAIADGMSQEEVTEYERFFSEYFKGMDDDGKGVSK